MKIISRVISTPIEVFALLVHYETGAKFKRGVPIRRFWMRTWTTTFPRASMTEWVVGWGWFIVATGVSHLSFGSQGT